MKCVQCGYEIENGRRFCGVCGAEQPGETAPDNTTGAEQSREPYGMPRQNEKDPLEITYGDNFLKQRYDVRSGENGDRTERPVFNERNEVYARARAAQNAQNAQKTEKRSRVPLVATLIGVVMVCTAIVMAVGMFVLGWFADTGPKDTPEETVRVAVKALDQNNCRAFLNCLKPDVKNETESILKNMTSGIGTMFGGNPPNSYDTIDKTIEYIKFILGLDKIALENTTVKDSEVNGKVTVTGDLYLGSMNMGKVVNTLEMVDGMWYISEIDMSGVDTEKMRELLPSGGLFVDNKTEPSTGDTTTATENNTEKETGQ